MLLSMSVSGLPFVGADVGGFFGNPSAELLLRWYQVAAYHPFFRAHAHHDTKRREPWVHGDQWTPLIRSAILARYSILPYLYTLYYQSYRTGVPIMRPLWAEFPEDEAGFSEQDTFLVGNAILVTPVTKEGVVTTQLRLPGNAPMVWYNTYDYQSYKAGETITLDTPIDRIAVFQRGGTIVPRKTRIRRSTAQMTNDPITLIIALDQNKNANGQIYIDDGDSFNFKVGELVYRDFSFYKGQGNSYILESNRLDAGKMQVSNRLEKLIIVGLPQRPVTIITHPSQRELLFDFHDQILTVKNPNVIVSQNWSIHFNC